jgi:signal transduction histidine kinase
MPVFHLDPTARLQRFLGRELIADPNLAVIEFVKNSYDAGASEVFVDFRLSGELDDHEILVCDNGIGMDVEAFEQNWMHPGYSYKVDPSASGTAPESPAAERLRARVAAGEKGLGRLAAGRLGRLLDVYTRQTPGDAWLHVIFDWDAFDRMDIPMRRVPVQYELGEEPPDARYTAGTVVRIRRPYFNWTHRVRGRKVPGRSDSRLGRLRQDLALVMDPFARGSEDFRIFLGVDRPDLSQVAGLITPEELSVYDYVWEFEIRPTEAAPTVRRVVRRSPKVVNKTGQAAESELVVPANQDDGGEEGATGTLLAGPIKGTFYYAPPQVAERGAALGRPPGVYLYRDRVRVEPYGSPGDDWLGVQARKASRQGYAAIQPNSLTGHVEITREANPGLIDMSNRNGLVENEAYDDLVARLRAEFRAFDALVLDELVRPNWEEPAARAQLAAQRAQAFTIALAAAAGHSIRQPVAALGAELEIVEAVAEKLADEALKHRLEGVVKRSRLHLGAIDASLERLSAIESVDLANAFAELDLSAVVEEAVARATPFAEAAGILIEAKAPSAIVISEPQALEEAVFELLRNGLRATQEAGRRQAVSVTIERVGRSIEILIGDHGAGIAESVRGRLFEETVSTSGQTGFGLIHIRELLALVSAQVELRSTGPDGSTFAIVVPAPASVRKEA